ncbi:hypothetical protein IFT91_24455 [Pseudomonas fluorescens]|nr:hypothetical protein [Pseudomonas fluorescens]
MSWMLEINVTNDLKFCAWLGPVGMLLLFLAMVPAGGFLPPPSPALEAAQLASFYAGNTLGIRLASMLFVTGTACYVVFYVAVSAAMMRMRPHSMLLSAIQLSSGIVGILPLFFAGMLLGVIAFRPERSADLVQAISDFAWVLIIMPASSVLPQFVALAIAIFRDRSEHPVFPRWVGYINIWTGVLFQSSLMTLLFHRGPFAWDGLFAFWVPFTAFAVWFYVMCWALLRIPASPAEEVAG